MGNCSTCDDDALLRNRNCGNCKLWGLAFVALPRPLGDGGVIDVIWIIVKQIVFRIAERFALQHRHGNGRFGDLSCPFHLNLVLPSRFLRGEAKRVAQLPPCTKSIVGPLVQRDPLFRSLVRGTQATGRSPNCSSDWALRRKVSSPPSWRCSAVRIEFPSFG